MKRVPLSRGKFALIDDSDFETVTFFPKWWAKRGRYTDYAYTQIYPYGNGERVIVLLHRLLLDFPVVETDHRNGDGLDNRRRNLRTASSSEQRANSKVRRENTSGYRGVSFRKGKWDAWVQFKGKQYWCGRYTTKQAAIKARDNKAIEVQGEFARTAGN